MFAKPKPSIIRVRVLTGMQNAKAKGRQIGRRPLQKEDIPAVFYRHYPAYAAGKMNKSELARVCNVSRPTVYEYLEMFEWSMPYAACVTRSDAVRLKTRRIERPQRRRWEQAEKNAHVCCRGLPLVNCENDGVPVHLNRNTQTKRPFTLLN